MKNINKELTKTNEEMINYIIERGVEEYCELIEEERDAGNNDEILCRVGGDKYDVLYELRLFILNNDITSKDSLTPRALKIFAKNINEFELEEVLDSLKDIQKRAITKAYFEIKEEEEFVAKN